MYVPHGCYGAQPRLVVILIIMGDKNLCNDGYSTGPTTLSNKGSGNKPNDNMIMARFGGQGGRVLLLQVFRDVVVLIFICPRMKVYVDI